MSKKSEPQAQRQRVAEYFRRSTEKQEDSIERQLSTVRPYTATKPWDVVATIEDRGISGWEVEKRKGLQELLVLVKSGKIDGVIVDDLSRLARLDIFEMAVILQPFRLAGVWIESASQGRVDYDTMSGRIMLGITSEGNKEQSLKTSYNAFTEILRQARDLGTPPLPKTPYGYLRIDDTSKPRNKRGIQPAKWIVDEFKASVVRQVFAWYHEGRTLNWIARELTRRAVPNPSGGPIWLRRTLRQILKNAAYIGSRVYGKTYSGKFYHQQAGELVRTVGPRKRGHRPKVEWMVGEDAHDPIITDRQLFEDVQDRLERTRVREVREGGRVVRRAGESTAPTQHGERYILSRLLVCGRCKAWMTGSAPKSAGRVKRYVCSRYYAVGRTACVHCVIPEHVILTRLLAAIRDLVSSERLAFIREKIHEHLQEGTRESELEALRKQSRSLGVKLKGWRLRLLEVSKDMQEDVENAIREGRAQQEELDLSIKRLEESDPFHDLAEAVDGATQALWRLEEAAAGENRAKLKEALHGIIETATVEIIPNDDPHSNAQHRAGVLTVVLRRGTGLDVIAELDSFPRTTDQLPTIILPAV
jgi:DNA invertase Pin-like site-specific DNA recombinase